MKDLIQLSYIQVGIAYVFILLVLGYVRWRGIHREKEIIIASVRMTLQLFIVGYVLQYVFENPSPFITILIIAIMEAFAVQRIYKRFRGKLSKNLKKVIAMSMVTGTLTCVIYFLLIVMGIKPWFNPRYFIPIAGMLIGNSMTGISLGINTLIEGMTTRRAMIEEALVLGATPKDASRYVINNAFDSAILPTINSMIGMGIIFLPGMMTGQILGGASPTTAIAYQIAIMLGILGAVALTVMLMIGFGYKTFFNADSQLHEEI